MTESLVKSNGVMEDVAAEIGYSATNALVDWFGGKNLHVPMLASEDHAIAKVIGLASMRRLVGMFNKATHSRDRMLWIPTGFEREINRRDRMIGEMFSNGMTVKQIMASSYMSQRHVELVRKRLTDLGMMEMPQERPAVAREDYMRELATMDGEGFPRNFGQK